MQRDGLSATLRSIAIAVVALTVATASVAILEHVVGVPNASSAFLVAVVASAFVAGAAGAVVSALGAFLLYNFLFTEPRFTLAVHDAGALLNLLVLLFVGIVVGQLASLQRLRADDAGAREREARAHFKVSRVLATRAETLAALPEIIDVLAAETRMTAVWITLEDVRGGAERVVTPQTARPEDRTELVNVLRRTPGDEPARWVRVHASAGRTARPAPLDTYRVRMDARGTGLGSIWALRDRSLGQPDATETRLLASAADQVAQAFAQDRLAVESGRAEVARQSDALKSALLQSVSHDLRTPLAAIRAAAGMLRPGAAGGPGAASDVDDQQSSADAIDREVAYLDRLVTNLLDLSRIESGALRADREAFELDDMLEPALARLRPRMDGRPLEVALGAPPVLADPAFVDQMFTNIVENALKYSDPPAALRITAMASGGDRIRLTVEDGGPGVAAEARDRLFEKFYRVPGGVSGSRDGTGIGLAVVRGLAEAMGARVAARPSELGGLAIDVDLARAPTPDEDLTGAAR